MTMANPLNLYEKSAQIEQQVKAQEEQKNDNQKQMDAAQQKLNDIINSGNKIAKAEQPVKEQEEQPEDKIIHFINIGLENIVVLFQRYNMPISSNNEDINILLDTTLKEILSLEARTHKLRYEIKQLQEYIQQSGYKADYRAYRARGGRKAKEIDWDKYDRLRAEGATQAQAAAILRVGVSTLRRKLAERKASI